MEEHHHHHEHENGSLHELVVLIKYMIAHNKSHTNELNELASKLKETNQEEAYRALLKAINTYNQANSELEEAFSKVKE